MVNAGKIVKKIHLSDSKPGGKEQVKNEFLTIKLLFHLCAERCCV
jgi:hypothetical protein